MATILYFRWNKKTTKSVPEYIVISETEPEGLTEEELDNWCDTGYRLYSKHKIEGDVVQLPCDTILVPGHQQNYQGDKKGGKVMSSVPLMSHPSRRG